MIGLPGTVRVFVAFAAADLRKGYDGLAQLAREVIREDPLSGHLFVFANRKRDRIKIIYWDRDGLAIWMKRLENEPFAYLRDVLDRVSTHPASRVDDLLPDRRVFPKASLPGDRKG